MKDYNMGKPQSIQKRIFLPLLLSVFFSDSSNGPCILRGRCIQLIFGQSYFGVWPKNEEQSRLPEERNGQ